MTRDRVQNSNEDLVQFIGSPAISMIEGRQPVQNSSFSKELLAAWTPRKADFIENAEEP
jgi:hypothetical protein